MQLYFPVSYNSCSICGNNNFIIPTINNFTQLHYLRKNRSIIYQKLELDKDGRLCKKCTVGENENLHNNYCQICGIDIINRCTGIKEEHSGFLTTMAFWETPLDGDARYCYICGARPTFLENEILSVWLENNMSEATQLT